MAVALPVYKERLKLCGFLQGDDAFGYFEFLAGRVTEWQVAQYESWERLEKRPLERWMRQYIAVQWTEFLDTVFWNMPALEQHVGYLRERLEVRQHRRNVVVMEQRSRLVHSCVNRSDALPFSVVTADCGPVIYGIPNDCEEDSVEPPRSVLETLQLVQRFTDLSDLPNWIEAACSGGKSCRLFDLKQDFARSMASSTDVGSCEDMSVSSESGDGEQDYDSSSGDPDEFDEPDMASDVPSSPTYSEVPDDFVMPCMNCVSPVYSEVEDDVVMPLESSVKRECSTFVA